MFFNIHFNAAVSSSNLQLIESFKYCFMFWLVAKLLSTHRS